MRELIQHYTRMKAMELTRNDSDAYQEEQKSIYISLQNFNTQFKKKRVDKKVNLVKLKYVNTPALNVYERCTG